MTAQLQAPLPRDPAITIKNYVCFNPDRYWTRVPRPTDHGIRPQGRNSYVYFIYFPALSLVKIGISTDLRRRLKSFESHIPGAAFMFGAFRGDWNDEAAAHRVFSRSRARREWFHASAELIAEVERYVVSRSGRFRPLPHKWLRGIAPVSRQKMLLAGGHRQISSAVRGVAAPLSA